MPATVVISRHIGLRYVSVAPYKVNVADCVGRTWMAASYRDGEQIRSGRR